MVKNIDSELAKLQTSLKKLENLHTSFDYLKITIASPERIKYWSKRLSPKGETIGEVRRAETLNYKTFKPEPGGLFCERTFGPIKNWKCYCGKYSGILPNRICELCETELIESRVRRYRMGFINLTSPMGHIWYFKGIPNYLLLFLKSFSNALNIKHLEQILYFHEGSTLLDTKNPFYPFLYRENDKFLSILSDKFKSRKGAEVLSVALNCIEIEKEIGEDRLTLLELQKLKSRKFLKLFLEQESYTIKEKTVKDLTLEKSILRRIRIFESFLATQTKAGWMILTILPILPPNLRPLLELEDGTLISSDINEAYRLVVSRNRRLHQQLYRNGQPDFITIQSRKLLQEILDSLIDNARVPKNRALLLNNRVLKSLTESLEGKQGLFRQNLLGKRVDYSGRSVIIVGPTLRLNQCGLPYDMVSELFHPFLIHELFNTLIKSPNKNAKLAALIIRKRKPFIWKLLEKLLRKYSILLNRAPTLHRFGIQAFDPILVLGKAIHLHPLVCTGFNADFDGDQMAVHLPLYETTQLEIKTMMRPSANILSPSNGEVILKPAQDMVIGYYYLTLLLKNKNNFIPNVYINETEALLAFYEKKIDIHSSIFLRQTINNFSLFYENKILYLNEKKNFKTMKEKITIFKIHQNKITKTLFILTNLGILVGKKLKHEKYQIKEIFFQTSPGRLIFNTNFNIIFA